MALSSLATPPFQGSQPTIDGGGGGESGGEVSKELREQLGKTKTHEGPIRRAPSM